jgi:hypothetical protein
MNKVKRNLKMTLNKLKTSTSLVVLSLILSTTPSFAQDYPSPEEMWEIIKKQQEQISKLEQIVGENAKTTIETKQQIAETEKKVEATASALEETASISQTPSQNNGTSIGGYAELHFNGGNKDEIDFHRFVLFMGHEFNEKIRFFSELEVEHSIAGEGKVGEVELEQAFVEFNLVENTSASVGLQLVPIGIINETHEPPTFYGVERNGVENNIIPATWWEAGVKFSGQIAEGLRYDAMVHSGLKTPINGGNAFKIRNGRQKVGEASWKNAAYTGRLSWIAAPGVKFAASFQYQDDLTQTSSTPTSATLFEVNTDIQHQISADGQIGLRALYAQWNLNSVEAELLGRDIQRGWYVEPSYKHNVGDGQSIGIFARYSYWDNNAGNFIDTANKQTSFGINYWPHQNVVLKADYQIDNNANIASEDNRINLGIGVHF